MYLRESQLEKLGDESISNFCNATVGAEEEFADPMEISPVKPLQGACIYAERDSVDHPL